jgi:hypothetical protein
MEGGVKHMFFVEKLGACLTANCLVFTVSPRQSGFLEEFLR